MPMYVYENANGDRKEMFAHVDERDTAHPGWRRRIAESITVGTGAIVPGQEHAVLRGFKQVEEKFGTSYVERASGFKARDIKRIWSEAP
jgi:hypothetical protein